MVGFLDGIADIERYDGQSEKYNREFFAKYIDLNVLISLLETSHTYSGIIDLLNKRHDKVDTDLLQKLDEELSVLAEEIAAIKKTQSELCDVKIDNTNLIMKMYEADEIDFNEIKELEEMDSQINDTLKKNNAQLEIMCSEEKMKNDKHKPIDEKRATLDINIENYIVKLKASLLELNGKNIDIFNGLDIDTLKEQYEQGLVETIQNTVARKAYVDNMFNILKRESKMIPQIYATAKHFADNAEKENGFDVPEVIIKNDQIILNGSITTVAYDGLRSFADIWCRNAPDHDKDITTIGKGYIATQPFINGMYDYVDNLPLYNQDHSKGGDAYDKLIGYNNQLEEQLEVLRTKDSKNLINIVRRITNNPGQLASIEREPYEFATRIFDNFNRTLDDVRTLTFDSKQTEMSNEEPLKQTNQTHQFNDFEIMQEPTEEQKRKLANNALSATVVTSSEETLGSSGMRR